jgi:luciferase-like monooxygenase
MTDYGHDLIFGTFITPETQRPQDVVELARLTERVGLDLVIFQDHPYQPAFLDTWTLLSYVAAQTERVRLSGYVLNLPSRSPAVLARAAASLDTLQEVVDGALAARPARAGNEEVVARCAHLQAEGNRVKCARLPNGAFESGDISRACGQLGRVDVAPQLVRRDLGTCSERKRLLVEHIVLHKGSPFRMRCSRHIHLSPLANSLQRDVQALSQRE